MAISKLDTNGASIVYLLEVYDIKEKDGVTVEEVRFREPYTTARAARNVGSQWRYSKMGFRVLKVRLFADIIKEIPRTKAEALRELAKTLD